MRNILITLFFCFSGCAVFGQTFGEWFRQKATQKKYLIEQIAALKVYSGFLKEGYNIGRKGLSTISSIKDGDFNLHRDFFGGLSLVSPAIKNYKRVADITVLQTRILKLSSQSSTAIQRSDRLSNQQKAYHSQVMERLIADCSRAIDDLVEVTLNGELTMTDGDRLQRVDALYAEMLDRYEFVKVFAAESGALIRAKEQGLKEAYQIKKLYGIPN